MYAGCWRSLPPNSVMAAVDDSYYLCHIPLHSITSRVLPNKALMDQVAPPTAANPVLRLIRRPARARHCARPYGPCSVPPSRTAHTSSPPSSALAVATQLAPWSRRTRPGATERFMPRLFPVAPACGESHGVAESPQREIRMLWRRLSQPPVLPARSAAVC